MCFYFELDSLPLLVLFSLSIYIVTNFNGFTIFSNNYFYSFISTLGKSLHCEYSMTSTHFVILITMRHLFYSYNKDSKRVLK